MDKGQEFDYYFERAGLSNTVSILRKGGPLNIAYLGGSVTVGASSTDTELTSWRALTNRYFRERYPQIEVRSVNGAIGGTDSTYGTFRLQEHVLEQMLPDLLFVEFSVNDAGDRTKSIRAMEGIVRQAKRCNPAMDICFVYTAREGEAEEHLEGKVRPNIVHHEEVASYYDLPSVNFSFEINDRIAAGVFTWKDISPDSVHPNDEGHALYARFMKVFLVQSQAAAQLQPDGQTQIPIQPLPTPLDPWCYEQGRMIDPGAVSEAAGWQRIEAWSTEKVCNWKPPCRVFEGMNPGDHFTFSFTGTAFGLALLVGMDAGTIDYSVDGGAWVREDLFDHYCEQFHRPQIRLLADELSHGTHSVQVRIADQRNPRSTGSAVRITRLLVN